MERSLRFDIQAIADQSPTKIRQLRLPTKLRSFEIDTQVAVQTHSDKAYSEVSVKTLDRPGLLAKIAEYFAQSGFDVLSAKILTLGEKAEDIFTIVHRDAGPITDEATRKQVETELIQHLSIKA